MNPNQVSQNTKRKFSLIAQSNSVPYSDENGDFHQSWIDKFQGSSKQITLLSITTAPTGTFEKGSQYYNSTDKLIYTAINDDTWTDATTSTPEFGTIYIYDNSGTIEYYIWDGDNLIETDLEKYQLKSNITDDYTSSSTTTYPSSKALNDGLVKKQSKNLTFTSVSASSWIVDNTYPGYDYKCDISCTGVTSNMVANVIFAPTESNSGNYATVCETSSNTVTIYSKVDTTIMIPVIIVMEV